MSTDRPDPTERAAGVLYLTHAGIWATPSDVPPPGRQRTPLAEVKDIHGRRIVVCTPTGHEYALHAFGDPVLGRDLGLTGKEAAQTFIAVVTWEVWRAWRFDARDLQDGEFRWYPLWSCWLDPWADDPS